MTYKVDGKVRIKDDGSWEILEILTDTNKPRKKKVYE